jgi:ABC-type polysaccharide/polyol phosphate transport system ATPase subunit
VAKDFVFTMTKLGKTFPNGKQVLRDIHLSFYYGAKIGVIGLNGAGKSTLFRLLIKAIVPQAGRIFLGGAPLESLGQVDVARLAA